MRPRREPAGSSSFALLRRTTGIVDQQTSEKPTGGSFLHFSWVFPLRRLFSASGVIPLWLIATVVGCSSFIPGSVIRSVNLASSRSLETGLGVYVFAAPLRHWLEKQLEQVLYRREPKETKHHTGQESRSTTNVLTLSESSPTPLCRFHVEDTFGGGKAYEQEYVVRT